MIDQMLLNSNEKNKNSLQMKFNYSGSKLFFTFLLVAQFKTVLSQNTVYFTATIQKLKKNVSFIVEEIRVREMRIVTNSQGDLRKNKSVTSINGEIKQLFSSKITNTSCTNYRNKCSVEKK